MGKEEKDSVKAVPDPATIAAALEAFKREMTEDVIPEILKVVEERRVLAAESRHQQLKC